MKTNILNWKLVWKEFERVYQEYTKTKPLYFDWTKQKKLIEKTVEEQLSKDKK